MDGGKPNPNMRQLFISNPFHLTGGIILAGLWSSEIGQAFLCITVLKLTLVWRARISNLLRLCCRNASGTGLTSTVHALSQINPNVTQVDVLNHDEGGTAQGVLPIPDQGTIII